MLKSMTRAMLTSAMGFAGDMIKTGERISETTTSWGDELLGVLLLGLHEVALASRAYACDVIAHANRPKRQCDVAVPVAQLLLDLPCTLRAER